MEDKEGEKRERRRNKNIRHMVDNSDRGGKLSKKAHKLANDYKHIHKTLNEVSTTEELIDALENYKLSMNEIFNERRVGVSFNFKLSNFIDKLTVTLLKMTKGE